MDELDNVAPQSFAVDPQDNLEMADLDEVSLPSRTIKTQAATLSMLAGDNDEAATFYDNVSAGSSSYQQQLIANETDRIRSSFKQYIASGVMDFLSDPNIDMDQKQSTIDGIRAGGLDNAETGEILLSQGLSLPAGDESEYGESVRLMTADLTREVNEAVSERQAIVNMIRSARDSTTFDTVKEILDLFVPAGMGVALARAEGDLYSTGESSSTAALAALLLPGSTIASAREKLISLPIGEQNEFFLRIKNAIMENSGVITKDNQLRALDLIGKITEGEYSSGEQFVDNMFQVLDIVGLGVLFRAGGRAASAVRPVHQAMDVENQAFNSAIRNAETAPGADLARPWPSGTPQLPNNVDKVASLEKEYENLIQVASNQLDEGMVTKLRAEREQIQAALNERVSVRDATMANSQLVRNENLRSTLTRIDNQLDAHREAVNASKQFTRVERELKQARASFEMQPAQFNPIIDAIRRSSMQGVVTDINPKTPGWMMYNTNKEVASNIHHMIFASQTDEAAQAMFAVNRNEALMNGIVPQVTTEAGRIKYAPDNLEKTTRSLIAQDIEELRYGLGGIEFTPKELASARANVVRDFSEALGMKMNTGMSSFAYDGEKVIVSGVYTNGESGWRTAEDAMAQAQFSLRNRGVDPGSMTVLRRDADEYVPVKFEEVRGVEGDYAIRIDNTQTISTSDVDEWENLDVKRNLLDRIFSGNTMDRHGSANRHVFDPASTLHQTIAGSAVVADDKTSVLAQSLLEMASSFTDKYTKLPRARQAKMFEYIKEANLKEIPFDPVDLKARRFSDSEVDMLKSWRDTWDAMYYLENADLVNTLRNQRFQWFSNSNLEAAVRPIPKNINRARVYDPASDTMRTLDRTEMDKIYESGGSLAEFRRPVTLHGEDAEQMIIRQTANEHSRAIVDTDRILNKREGYYQITYRAPKFIDETYLDANGVSRTRTIGVAGSTKEANDAVALIGKRSPGSTFRIRGDERGLQRDSDTYWDLNNVGGRIAQRHRGKILENAVGTQLFGSGDFIDSPADSAVKAIMSISGRTAMRPVLDAAKERFINQYGRMLSIDERTRKPVFPQSRSDIRMKGEMTSKDLADARTTFEYINYLENGYINAVDDAIKNALHVIADGGARLGANTLEKGINSLAEVSLTGQVKGAVFASMIASNPLRQWIVQSNQVMRTMAYNPAGWLTGRIPGFMQAMGDAVIGKKLTGVNKDFVDFVNNTGMFQAVSKNNLIRGTLLDISDRQNRISRGVQQGLSPVIGKTLGTAVARPVDTLRKVGFDLGEKANITGHAAAVYDEYLRKGANVLDTAVQAEMHAKIRNLTWNMNFAGDMPYNQNALALIMTYMQVPHKALLQATNRGLSRGERLRLVTADMALWGLPTALIAGLIGNDWLPDNDYAREMMVDGLQSLALNYSLTALAGEKVNIDLSSLAPYDMDGWKDLMFGLFFDGGISAAVERAPVARVFGLSPDSRTGMAIQTARGYFKDLFTEPEIDRVTFLELMDSMGKMSSGWNNFQKARAMYASGVARDKLGRLVDNDVHHFEAFGQALGFGPKSVKQYYETLIAASNDVKDWQDQGKKDAQEFLQMFVSRRNGNLDVDYTLQMFSQYMASMSTIPGEQNKVQYLSGLLGHLQSDPNVETMNSLAKYLGFEDPAAFRDRVLQSPLDDEAKALIIKTYEEQTNYIKGMKE